MYKKNKLFILSIVVISSYVFFGCTPPSPYSEKNNENVILDNSDKELLIGEKKEKIKIEPQEEKTIDAGILDKKVQEQVLEPIIEPIIERDITREKINPCQPNPCVEAFRHICQVKLDQAICLCDEGYELIGGKCKLKDPCLPNPCKQSHKTHCKALPTKNPPYQCLCDNGYQEENGKCVRIPPTCDSFYQNARRLRDLALKKKLHDLSGLNYDKYGYSDAREKIFLEIDNIKGKVRGVYTGRWVTLKNGKIPKSNDMNIEHTWPRSNGAVGRAESDMYHLFPTDSRTNSARGSYPFGLVVTSPVIFGTSTYFSRRGRDSANNIVFEVALQHRGNVARAMFYFSIRYSKKINDTEEQVLRKWNQEDPIDQNEILRAGRIRKLQKNRNPFIDCPQFVGQIKDF